MVTPLSAPLNSALAKTGPKAISVPPLMPTRSRRPLVVRLELMADRCLLYYITDRSQFRGDEHARRRALLAKVSEAARAGVEYIHLREKDLSARELEMLARDALAAVRNSVPLRTENRELSTGPELRTRLLINSRTDVALAVGADGVHLRADDITP